MRPNKTGKKSHRSIVRYGRLKSWHGGESNSSVNYKILYVLCLFCFVLFVCLFFLCICLYIFYYPMKFLTDFQTQPPPPKKKKNLHYLQPVKSKTIGIGIFNSRFLKNSIQKKLLTSLGWRGYSHVKAYRDVPPKWVSISPKILG